MTQVTAIDAYWLGKSFIHVALVLQADLLHRQLSLVPFSTLSRRRTLMNEATAAKLIANFRSVLNLRRR